MRNTKPKNKKKTVKSYTGLPTFSVTMKDSHESAVWKHIDSWIEESKPKPLEGPSPFDRVIEALRFYADGKHISHVSDLDTRQIADYHVESGTKAAEALKGIEATESALEQSDQEFIHVADWIDEWRKPKDDNELYAQFFFELFLLPAYKKMKYDAFLSTMSLFCMYKGECYRVTGCSTMGDVWLTKNYNNDQYQLRVNVRDCSDWSKTPKAEVVDDN